MLSLFDFKLLIYQIYSSMP